MARGRNFRRGGGGKAKSEKVNPEVQIADTKPEHDVAVKKLEQHTPAKGGRKGGEKSKKSLRNRKKISVGRKGAGEPVTDFAGLIFMCNTETKKDCFKHHVFGFPEAKKDIIGRAKKGIKLFLFDIDQKVLYGVYKASSLGGMNLVSEAFQDSERKFPAQIRFRIHKDCAPLDENIFKPVIKENYFGRNKFRSELSSEQVVKLLQLFRPLDALGLPKPKLGKGAQHEPSQRGNVRRVPAQQKGNVSRGPRIGAPPGSGRSAKPRQPPSAEHYPRSLTREPLPINFVPHTQSGYFPGQVLSNPDISRLDAEILYRQRLEALDRRAYVVDPVLDASLRQVGASSEFGRRKFPDNLYTDERSLPPLKGSLLYEDLYREMPYQREALYSSRDDGRTYGGNLPYKPLTSLSWGYS